MDEGIVADLLYVEQFAVLLECRSQHVFCHLFRQVAHVNGLHLGEEMKKFVGFFFRKKTTLVT